jgi:hypothetical protein
MHDKAHINIHASQRELPSASEDMLAAALEASHISLSRLKAIRNEINNAIERETLQVERLVSAFPFDSPQKL